MTCPELFRLDPRTTLAVVGTLNVVMFSAGFTGGDAAARLIFLLIPAVLAVGVGRIAAALAYLAVSLSALAVERWLLAGDLAGAGALLTGLAGLVSRLAPGLFMGYVAVVSIRVSEFMASLEELRIPRQLVIPAAVVLRFLPTVGEESAAGATARSARGGSLLRVGPLPWLEYRLIPLLISTVKSGEELSQAALTRGLGRPGRAERICRIGLRPPDVVTLLTCLAGLGVWIVG
ncbi:MAG: energy-coupling factor transporter transmembrane component T [Propionicimonas sp.]|nr:energy-coupling factor transporter transmembrane component T [Propionicimonas sp.]